MNANRFRPSVEGLEHRDTPSAVGLDTGFDRVLGNPGAITPSANAAEDEILIGGNYIASTHVKNPQAAGQIFVLMADTLAQLDKSQEYTLKVQGQEVTLVWVGLSGIGGPGSWYSPQLGATVNHNETLVRDGG